MLLAIRPVTTRVRSPFPPRCARAITSGRLGGDEFGVLLCDDAAEGDIADRLLGHCARAHPPSEDLLVHVTAAIGIALAPKMPPGRRGPLCATWLYAPRAVARPL